MKRILFGSVILLTLITASCKKSSTNNTNNNIPSNCTNTTGWLVNGHKQVYTNEPIYFFADSMYVDITDVGGGVFKGTTTFDDGSLYAPFSSYMKPCGLDIYQGTSSTMANSTISYKTDGSVSDTWSNQVTSTGGYTVTNTFTITGKNVSTTVPAGTFSCLVFHVVSHSTQPGSIEVDTDIYYNNTYGMIKTDGNTSHYELARKNF